MLPATLIVMIGVATVTALAVAFIISGLRRGRKCRACGRRFPEAARFCPHCGRAAE